MKLIDSHCHLHYDYAPKTILNLIQEAQDAGVTHFISVGTDFNSLEPLKTISETYESVYFTVGIHPHDSKLLEGPQDLEKIRQAAQHPRCKAIGEIGLDYYYTHSEPKTQIQALESQLNLAIELKKPVVIHSRDAEGDLLPRLQAYAEKQKKQNSIEPVGVIHCFTGSLEFGQACLDAGFFISFSGIVTFKNAELLRDAAKTFPLEKILVETDSPYLAPIPYRGKKCEPIMIVETAKKIAEIKGCSLETIAQATYQNTIKAFDLF